MALLAVRKSGGTSIISIPKAVLETLGLHIGSSLHLSLENNKIVLMPVKEEMTLDELLAGSPKERLSLSNEDKQWLGAKPVGKEF